MNPFYILRVSSIDSRRSILMATEEMGFLSDPDTCLEAQNVLLNPSRRLGAELDWFVDIEPEIQEKIRKQIETGETIQEQYLPPLSKLNAALYQFCITTGLDPFELGMDILEINERFCELDVVSLTEYINSCRTEAKMSGVSQWEVSSELTKKRERIRILISQKLQSLKEIEYIEVITIFAKKYLTDETYCDSGILSDCLDQYELWVKSKLDAREDQIRKQCAKIRILNGAAKLKKAVDDLIALLKTWNLYARPLQIHLITKGLEDPNSRKLAVELQNIAVYLHNERNLTALSLQITETLKDCFAQLPDVLESLLRDIETLREILKKKEAFERKKRQNKRADKIFSVDVFGDAFVVPPFCTCCMKSTQNREKISYFQEALNGISRTTRTVSVNMPICSDCLAHRKQYHRVLLGICAEAVLIGGVVLFLCIMANAESFLSVLLAGVAAVGTYYLLSVLMKTQELSYEHTARGKSANIFTSSLPLSQAGTITFRFTNWEYAQLFQEANREHAGEIRELNHTNTAKETSVLAANERHVKTMFQMLAVLAAGIMIFVMVGTFGYIIEPSLEQSSAPSQTFAVSEAKWFSQSVSSGTPVYVDVVSIEPSIGIGYNENANTDVVCKCETSDGSMVWVYMTVQDYITHIDSTARITNPNSTEFEAVRYSSLKRIRGTAQRADDLCEGLSEDTSPMVLEFSYISN